MTTIRLSSARSPLKPTPVAARLAALVATLVAALFLTSAGTPAQAGDPPFSHPLASSHPVASCIASERYVVVSRSGDGTGNDIFALPASGRLAETCALNRSPEEFRVAKAGEAKSVLALRGKFLVLDEGTGPSIRRLVVVDLSGAGEVWSAQYVPEPTPDLTPRGLVFHKYLRIARKNDCRNARKIILQGLTPLYVVEGELSLPALAFKATGQARCVAGQ
jgi:hypothetical protein